MENDICKQNEDDEQNEEAPSENSESQQYDDDSSSSEKDEIPQSQSKMTKSEPWDRIMETVHDTLQDTFDETCKIYIEQNTGMEITEAEKKVFDELKSNYRQAILSQYHDLVQMGKNLEKDPIDKQIMATAQTLQTEEDYHLACFACFIVIYTPKTRPACAKSI